MGFSAEALLYIYKTLGKNITGVEIGVCCGENILALLNYCPGIRKIYGIDPWTTYKDKLDISQQKADDWFEIAKANLRDHEISSRVELLRLTSAKGVFKFEDASLDFVFIDGNHSRESVMEDLNLWFPKVMPGGIFSGHDFRLKDHEVRKAVYDFAEDKKIIIHEADIHCEPTCWYHIKGKL